MSDQVIHRWQPSIRLITLARCHIARVEGKPDPQIVLSGWRNDYPLLRYLQQNVSDKNVKYTRAFNALGRYMSQNGSLSVDRFLKELAMPNGGMLYAIRDIGIATIAGLRTALKVEIPE